MQYFCNDHPIETTFSTRPSAIHPGSECDLTKEALDCDARSSYEGKLARGIAAGRRPAQRLSQTDHQPAAAPLETLIVSVQLAALKKINSYDQTLFVEKGGWATMPGNTEPGSGVAKACAVLITNLK